MLVELQIKLRLLACMFKTRQPKCALICAYKCGLFDPDIVTNMLLGFIAG